MTSLVPPETTRTPICDYCGRVQTPQGAWLALHPRYRPAEHLLAPDICPDCCARYAAFLLDPETDGDGPELAMPPFRHRPLE
jgi:hypothetical protein